MQKLLHLQIMVTVADSYSTNLNVQLVDPNGQVGIGVQVQVINSLLDSVQDVRERLVVKHASLQRANFEIYFLFDQQEVIHLKTA